MSKPKILIIDDDNDMVEAMRIVLENNPYEVLSAPSGGEGLKIARSEKPDLVILDVMMETGDKGFDIARALRKDPELSKVPILMLTAIREKTGFDFRNEAGDETWLPVDDYLEKPIHPDLLLEKVKKYLSK
jgi:CheY-like chemotaxis protein